MATKDIIKSLNELADLAVKEDVLQDTPVEETDVAPTFNDGMSLADTLDAKTKIARALENLKAGVEEFKNATAEKVDLLKDNLLLQQIEGLDTTIAGIEQTLASGSILGDSSLNDPFKAELPAETEPVEDAEIETGEIEREETEESSDEDEEEDAEDYNFDDEAGLDLLGGEDEAQ